MVDYVGKAQERIQRANEEMNAGNFEGAANYLNAASPYAGRAGNGAVNDAYGSAQQRLLDLQTGGGGGAGDGSGGGGGGGGGKSYEQILAEQEAARQAELERRRSMNAVESLRGLMDSYGLSGMMDQIQAWVTDGYESDAIMALIRQTPQYKDRFPAMDALARKGRAISEAEYIAFERNAAQMERAYGLPEGMLTDKNNITNLLTNEVSARELQERVDMAAAGQFQMSPEMRRQFKEYYGIDGGGLTAYFLDPDKALPLLTRQYASSAIGAEAAMQDIGITSNLAESLYEYGIDRDAARQGFGRVAGQQGLTAGKGETISTGELIQGNLMEGQSQQEKAQRIGQTRVGKFSGGGGFAADKQGVSGLGSASA